MLKIIGKLILSALLIVGFGRVYGGVQTAETITEIQQDRMIDNAEYVIPRDLEGNVPTSKDLVGCNVFTIGVSTGTSPALLYKATTGQYDNPERVNSGLIYGVMLGTGTAGGSYIILVDSEAATTSDTNPLCVVICESATANTIVVFPAPIIFDRGLSVQNRLGDLTATVFWRERRAHRSNRY